MYLFNCELIQVIIHYYVYTECSRIFQSIIIPLLSVRKSAV